MPLPSILALYQKIRATARHGTRTAKVVLALGIALAVIVGAAIVARRGTERAILEGRVFFLVAVGLAFLFLLVRLLLRENPRKAIRRTVTTAAPELGPALDRAVGLSERERVKPSSDRLTADLVELHLDRQIGRIPFDRIALASERRGVVLATIGLFVVSVAAGIAAWDPLRLVEGIDVALSRKNVAPFPLVYLDEVDLLSSPPAYLQEEDETLDAFDEAEVPSGATISVRGKRLRDDRELVLTDGRRRVSFVEDGSGLVVARWSMRDEPATLRIAARLGDTLVYQHEALEVAVIPDLAPKVTLKDAPRTVKLVDVPSVSLVWEAKDDHGLREVALVLRSGDKEEKRSLVRPALGTKVARGGHELSQNDPFIKKALVPVEVTIEARDNDDVVGNKWGKSPAIVLLSPDIGEQEAARYAALQEALGVLVDLTAAREIARSEEKLGPKAAPAEERLRQDKAVRLVEDALAKEFGALKLRGNARRIARGQLRQLEKALADYEKAPTKPKYDELVSTSERVVLAFDSALQGLGRTDAVSVAKRLGTVAEGVAKAAREAQTGGDRKSIDHRIQVSIDVLGRGGKHLAKLGELGGDLGDVTRGGVARIQRTFDGREDPRTAFAATDLAERLKRASASISGGGKPGVEGGGGGDGEQSAEGGDASEADSEAEQGGKGLDELIREHQQKIGEIADLMRGATTEEERERLSQMAKEQAERMREAVKDLPPRVDQGGDAARSAAEGRKLAESGAGALEQGDFEEAERSVEDAAKALQKSEELGQNLVDEDIAREARRARSKLEDALDTLRNMQKELAKNAGERAKPGLEKAAGDEARLAERAKQLAERGAGGDGAMPDKMLESLKEAEAAMRRAEQAFRESNTKQGAEEQRVAQRHLELARENDGNEDGQSDDDGDSGRMAQNAEVPGKDKHRDPEAFRKRVTDGMSKPADARLREAIRKYTEGLIK